MVRGLACFILAMMTVTTANAQTERVVFSAQRIQVERAVAEIEKQTGYSFIYGADMLEAGAYIDFGSRETTVKSAVEKIIEGRNLRYFVRNNYIVINRNETRPQPIVSRTGDVYRRNDPNAVDGFYGSNKRYVPVHDAVRFDTIVKPGKVLPYPDPYSDYKPAQNYRNYPYKLPVVAIKTNLLYTATTFTPNLAVEVGIGDRSTIEVSGSYNWQGMKKAASDNHKQRGHVLIRPEYRYWLCERFNGHYFGGHAIYFKYNVSGYKVPMLFEKDSRYDGNAYGVGFTYGYHLPLAKRWGLDFNVGAGYMYMSYDRFSCAKCDRQGKKETKNYFGPTRAGVSLVFMIR